jgi:uncharacterized protein YjbI with pentapeptide repeats
MGQSPIPPAAALAGKKVAIVGRFIPGNQTESELRGFARTRGAAVVTGKGEAPDYLVEVFETQGPAPPLSAQIQKKHRDVEVLSRDEFQKLLAFTADELLAVLRTGPHDEKVWTAVWWLMRWAGHPLTLRGADLRGRNVSGAHLYEVKLEGADLQGATLHRTTIYDLTDCNLDGATLTDSHIRGARNCTFRKAVITRGVLQPPMSGCDFTGAKLTDVSLREKMSDFCFDGAELVNSDGQHGKFVECSFVKARMPGAALYRADLSGCDLSGADLTGANLWLASLAKADLTNATVRDAVLVKADLGGAKVAGADFAGSNLTGATDKGVNWSKARNAVLRPAARPGPNLRKLGQAAAKAKNLSTSIKVDLGPGETVILSVIKDRQYATRAGSEHQTKSGRVKDGAESPTADRGMLNLGDRWSLGTPRLDSVAITAQGSGVRADALKTLAVAAWCEAFGRPVPSEEERTEQESSSAADRDSLLGALRSGKVGAWNKRPERDRVAVGPLKGTDLSGVKLARANFKKLDLRNAKLAGANLSQAAFEEAKLTDAVFDKADLTRANLVKVYALRASFAGANLTRARLRASNLKSASFAGANLTGADLIYADLTGADLSGARLDGAKLDAARFDDKTVLPAGFVPPKEMKWVGKGHRPRPTAVVVAKPGVMDFNAFHQSLSAKVDPARMEKAKSMLKADRFQLFAEVTADGVIGVVKSQSTDERLYSCRLGAEGSFGCCTQNLNICGGLRGAVCKHLLVLMLGLAKAGQLDPATADAWVDASKAQKPEIDSDEMSEAFLKYKGAEAGEIDWRPTETIPEDFYAM